MERQVTELRRLQRREDASQRWQERQGLLDTMRSTPTGEWQTASGQSRFTWDYSTPTVTTNVTYNGASTMYTPTATGSNYSINTLGFWLDTFQSLNLPGVSAATWVSNIGSATSSATFPAMHRVVVPPPPLPPGVVAAREAYLTPEDEDLIIEERRRVRHERDVQRAVAKDTAMELFLGCLTPAQKEDWEREQFIIVFSNKGNPFEIKRGRMHNIYRLDPEGKRLEEWCVTPHGQLPLGDVLVSQKLYLETDEDYVRSRSNITVLGNGQMIYRSPVQYDGIERPLYA